MKLSAFIVICALLGSLSNVQAVAISQKIAAGDFNGADEDEIMDKVFSKYSVEGTDHNGVKNGQKILMKQTAPKAAGVILEATHKLKGNQVPGYLKANFEKAWNKFDINQDGFIKAEETHTFMRSLMGKLNKFALAPGSLSDISGEAMAAPPKPAEPVIKAAPAPAPKKVAMAEETAEAAADESAEAKTETKAEDETLVNLDY
jgi:hypothetical protein